MEKPLRTIKQIISTVDVQMGDITIGQPLPTSKVKQISPFLLLHHLGPLQVAPGVSPMNIGAHPHRGFAPVTFVFSGEVSHLDSLGNQRVVSSGGVQWMSAGRGVIHEESAGRDFVTKGGSFELIQLWVNLPSSIKMSEPSYQPFDAREIPCYQDPDGLVKLNVICGSFLNFQGPVKHPTEINAYTLFFEPGGELNLDTISQWNLLLYQLGGESSVNGQTLSGRQLAYFNHDANLIIVKALKQSRFLIVSAPPINEPLAQYGPFVMNRPEELNQAINDCQTGKMGRL